MTGRWERGMHRKIGVFIALLTLAAAISGCAEVQQRYEEWINALRPEKQTDPRDEAIRASRYRGLKDEVFFGKPNLTPSVVCAGDRVTQELPFVVLAPWRKTIFRVVEVITLSGEEIVIELSRIESEKPQGKHISTLQFIIPRDLPPGNYKLTTTIIANGTEKSQIASFVVEAS